MSDELTKFIRMFQPDENEWVRFRRDFIPPTATASDKGLQFLSQRYRKIVQLWHGSRSMETTEDYYKDEIFPPIPSELDIDLPVDLPRSGESGPTVEFDLTPYANTELKLTYKGDEINISADELWDLIRGIMEV